MLGNTSTIRCTKCFSDKYTPLSSTITTHEISDVIVCDDCGTIIKVNYKIVIDYVEEIKE